MDGVGTSERAYSGAEQQQARHSCRIFRQSELRQCAATFTYRAARILQLGNAGLSGSARRSAGSLLHPLQRLLKSRSCWRIQAGSHSHGMPQLRAHSARLYIDDHLLMTDSQRAGEQMYPKTAPVQLEAGKAYKLRADYLQAGGGGGLELVWTPPAAAAVEAAVKLTKTSDLTILCFGLNSRLEGEESKLVTPGFEGGDRTDIRLPEPQRNLVEAVFNAGKPVIVVLVSGSALAVDLAKQRARAILEWWYGGQEAGTAIANTLRGRNNPAGRLPITFYESVEQLPPFTDYSMTGRTYRHFEGQPMYPFGYGLSYSDFKYSDLKIARSLGSMSRVSATVTGRTLSLKAGPE
jgi:beta-glucosidase